jgi:hypothetical protein
MPHDLANRLVSRESAPAGEKGNFYAGYIRGTLEICGVSLVGAGHAPAQAVANLDEMEFSAIVGCVAVGLAADTIAALGMH